jgi:hypothetical protein
VFGGSRQAVQPFGGESQPRAFTLTHSAVSPNGVIAATAARKGEVKTASRWRRQ